MLSERKHTLLVEIEVPSPNASLCCNNPMMGISLRFHVHVH